MLHFLAKTGRPEVDIPDIAHRRFSRNPFLCLKIIDLLTAAGKSVSTSIHIKSGFMVGLGETDAEVTDMLTDLKSIGCEIVTIGQLSLPKISSVLHPKDLRVLVSPKNSIPRRNEA